jgi:hypothetical protein
VIWLGVGVFVLFKQGSRSPFVLHFATVCLAAFVFHTFRSIGIGRDFDLAVDLLDNIAFAFFAPLFLHFCLRYPVRSNVFTDDRWKTYALYAPAAVISLVLVYLRGSPDLVRVAVQRRDRVDHRPLRPVRAPLSTKLYPLRGGCRHRRVRTRLASVQEPPAGGATAPEVSCDTG